MAPIKEGTVAQCGANQFTNYNLDLYNLEGPKYNVSVRAPLGMKHDKSNMDYGTRGCYQVVLKICSGVQGNE